MRTILKYILAGSLILLAGCTNEPNLDIQQLDQQAIALSGHLYDISGENDYYQNQDIDFSLLIKIKKTVLERGQNLITDFRDDKIDEETLSESLTKTASLLYFIWMEEADAARRNNDLDNLQIIQAEHQEFGSQPEVVHWIDNQGKKVSFAKVQEYLNNMPKLLERGLKIDENNEKLNVLKTDADKFKTENNITEYNQTADEYNALLEENNKLVDEYNSSLESIDYNSIYNNFIDLIDVDFIFPGQDTIPLKK